MQLSADEQQILRLFEDGDRARIAADRGELARIYADDYLQFDESGKCSTKQDVIDDLTKGSIRYISMTSTGRQIRLLSDTLAVVHGSEEDEIDQNGRRRLTAMCTWMS